jgi:hypothetical protein
MSSNMTNYTKRGWSSYLFIGNAGSSGLISKPEGTRRFLSRLVDPADIPLQHPG